jgi:hypothetical protein
MALILPHPDGDKRVHGDGNCGGVEQGYRAGAQNSPLDQNGKDDQLPFEPKCLKKMLQKRPFRPLKRPYLRGPRRQVFVDGVVSESQLYGPEFAACAIGCERRE